MFDFNSRRDICLQGMKSAYNVGFYGDNPKVLDGTWKQAFDDDAEGPTEGDKGGPGGLGSWEDADGAEGESKHDDGPEEEEEEEEGGRSTTKSRGHKRENSQSKLDFGKGKKKAKK
jgi:cryptochrome